MDYLEQILEDGEVVICQGYPAPPLLEPRYLFTHVIPGVLILAVVNLIGVIDIPMLVDLRPILTDTFCRVVLTILALGLICFPWIRRAVLLRSPYIITNRRAITTDPTGKVTWEELLAEMSSYNKIDLGGGLAHFTKMKLTHDQGGQGGNYLSSAGLFYVPSSLESKF